MFVEDVVLFICLFFLCLGNYKIVVLILLCMVNFDDVDLLWLELSIDFEWIVLGNLILCDVEVIMFFGIKFLLGDLVFI